MNTGSVLGDPTGTFAVLRRGQERWMGRLMLRPGGGPAQLAFPPETSIAALPLGTVMLVGVAGPAQARPAQCRARLIGVANEASAVAVEIEVDDPAVWGGVMPKTPGPYQDRRRWPRLQPAAAREDPVQVIIDVGAHSARVLAGYVMDRSEGGLAVRLPMQVEERVCEAGTILCRGLDDRHAYHCVIRNRTLLPLGVRYGLQFDGDPIEIPPTFEPLWTCGECGAGPLLGHSHTHCPSCGSARGDIEVAYPDWDDLVAVEEHPFFGADRACLRCGSAFSRSARNCGHCGTRLPVSC